MTTREKVAHLYRRLAFGATALELDQAALEGVDKTIDRLVNFEGQPDVTSPYEFAFKPKDEPQLGSHNFRQWWVYEMLTGPNPLRDKMAIFWHSHFAVSDGKVEDGQKMLEYLKILRTKGLGRFEDLLEAMSKSPAMMRYLDMTKSVRGNPNENFGREVMELFTLGIGNYTETDVQEVSRAFTGWGYTDLFWELPGTTEAKVREAIKLDRPFSSFTYMSAWHDPTLKTILGRKGNFDGDQVLALLAAHPKTAERLCQRLWEYLAYADPEPALVQRLAKGYQKSQGDIRKLVLAIVRAPEFWSERCVGQRVKDPADYVLSMAKQMNAKAILTAMRAKDATETTPMPDSVLNNLWHFTDRMEKAGLNLLFPEDVSGWKWGEAWISPASMIERHAFRGAFYLGDNKVGDGANFTYAIAKARNPQTPPEVVACLEYIFDVKLRPDSAKVMAAAVEKHNGLASLKEPGWWVNFLSNAMITLTAAPEFHFN